MYLILQKLKTIMDDWHEKEEETVGKGTASELAPRTVRAASSVLWE